MDFTNKIIDGKAIAAEINRRTADEVAAITKDFGSRPGLAVVLVGDDPASKVYVASKVKRCQELGIHSEKIVLPAGTTQQELLDVIDKLNNNPIIQQHSTSFLVSVLHYSYFSVWASIHMKKTYTN